MSRAEDLAMELFKPNILHCKSKDVDLAKDAREIFLLGYHQAEKDIVSKGKAFIENVLLSLHSVKFKERVVDDFIKAISDE